MIRVLVADDHQLFIDGIRSLLEPAEHITVTEQALSGKQVLEKLSVSPVDVALIDISMPDMDGIETTQQLLEKFPETKVIALSMHTQVAYIVRMMRAGARGYLLKHTDKTELVRAIETIYNGGVYYSAEVAVNLVNKMFKEGIEDLVPQVEELTSRELEIVKLIVNGEANKNIADKLFISEATVKTHRQRILHKLQLKSTAELIRYAYQKNLF